MTSPPCPSCRKKTPWAESYTLDTGLGLRIVYCTRCGKKWRLADLDKALRMAARREREERWAMEDSR